MRRTDTPDIVGVARADCQIAAHAGGRIAIGVSGRWPIATRARRERQNACRCQRHAQNRRRRRCSLACHPWSNRLGLARRGLDFVGPRRPSAAMHAAQEDAVLVTARDVTVEPVPDVRHGDLSDAVTVCVARTMPPPTVSRNTRLSAQNTTTLQCTGACCVLSRHIQALSAHSSVTLRLALRSRRAGPFDPGQRHQPDSGGASLAQGRPLRLAAGRRAGAAGPQSDN